MSLGLCWIWNNFVNATDQQYQPKPVPCLFLVLNVEDEKSVDKTHVDGNNPGHARSRV